MVILYEAFGQWRQIQMDGRALVKDPNPCWLGYSTGRWDGDTLVVTTTGFNGKTWLDTGGHPTTEALIVTERFRRPSFGRLEIEVTIDDAKAYTKPWTRHAAHAPLTRHRAARVRVFGEREVSEALRRGLRSTVYGPRPHSAELQHSPIDAR